MPKTKLVVHPAAEAETLEAAQYYLDRRSSAAIRFEGEVRRAFGLIADSPSSWVEFVPPFRRLILPTFPYSVVYIFDGQTVEVIAVAHHSRRPQYWEDRKPMPGSA